METIRISICGNQASVDKIHLITSGTVGLPVEFSFDEQWEGLSKTAVFKAGNTIRDQLNIDKQTTVPAEVLYKARKQLEIGVYGTNEDGTIVVPTVWVSVGHIFPGADPSGDESADPSLPVWAQIRKEVYDAISTVETDAPTDEKYFDIDDYGLVSLKAEYRADGANNADLPETIIIPDVINGTAVTALQESMFEGNKRVKSVTIPGFVTAIPKKFANKAFNLTEINGTENVEIIGQTAFQMCGIKKALFPNLKSFDGVAQFNMTPNLAIVDIGDAVTNIPTGCFNGCESLSAIRGGASVTAVGDKGMFCAHSLLNVPFTGNLKSIGKQGFEYSRVNYDWWTFKASGQCTFGTNATPAHWNPSDWWSGCTPVACENPLGSTFNQHNPEWESEYIKNSASTYGSGCLEVSTAHIYSALAGVELDSPKEFVEDIVGSIDSGTLLTPTGTNSSGGAEYTFADMDSWLTALGLNCELLDGGWNNENLQMVYDALAEGALVLTYINPGHAGVIYGVTSNGEMMVLESASNQRAIENYVTNRIKMKIQNLTIKGGQVMIVKKGE